MNNMIKLEIPCNPANYGRERTEKVQYIVVHYTGGDGDTARNNGLYFQREILGSSAHWFVDEASAVLSVPENMVAWHCGAAAYCHPSCRNGNSIGVELCSKKNDRGEYVFAEATLENGAQLVRKLMKQYGLTPDRVLRHYDVTGKKCPAPLVEAGRWKEFLAMATRYQKPEDVPQWAQATVEKLIEQGTLQGDGQGLDLSHDMVRMLVILDRRGIFG